MRRITVLLAAMAVMVVGYAGAALAAPVDNGGFETGNLQGWTVVNEAGGSGNWYVCSTPATCPAPVDSSFPTPEGTYAALSSQTGPGSHILYQDVTLPSGMQHDLSFTTSYRNYAGAFYTPNSLSYLIGPNQQYRVDIMKPEAPVNSVDPTDILATVFRTQVGDPLTMAPTPMTSDLSQFAGSTVRLRFAEVDNQTFFVAGVDDVKVKSTHNFTGFFSPVDNPDVATNKAKAGSSIPVKFSLGGDKGLDIFATGTNPTTNETFDYPTSTQMTCDSTDELDAIEETVTAGGSSLQYDASLDQYTYVWKTDKAWAGTCRQLIVKLDDGTYHRANFNFVK